jgi:hypothetical protein
VYMYVCLYSSKRPCSRARTFLASLPLKTDMCKSMSIKRFLTCSRDLRVLKDAAARMERGRKLSKPQCSPCDESAVELGASVYPKGHATDTKSGSRSPRGLARLEQEQRWWVAFTLRGALDWAFSTWPVAHPPRQRRRARTVVHRFMAVRGRTEDDSIRVIIF